MSRFSTDFAVGMGLLKGYHGDAVTYKDENDSETAIANAIFIESDAGEADDGRGRSSLLTARVLIDATDLAVADRRGKITRGGKDWIITMVELNGGVLRLSVERTIRDDYTVGELRS